MSFDALALLGIAVLVLLAFAVRSRSGRAPPLVVGRVVGQIRFRLVFVAVYLAIVALLFCVGLSFVEMPDLIPFVASALIIGVSLALADVIVEKIWRR